MLLVCFCVHLPATLQQAESMDEGHPSHLWRNQAFQMDVGGGENENVVLMKVDKQLMDDPDLSQRSHRSHHGKSPSISVGSKIKVVINMMASHQFITVTAVLAVVSKALHTVYGLFDIPRT